MTSAAASLRVPAGLEGWARRLGVVFGDFLAEVARRARARGSERVFFLSREGHWFAETYAAMRERTPEGALYPPAVHLPVSRRATFLPSLDGLDGAAMGPLLAQYRDASVQAVLTSLGWFEAVSPEQAAALAARIDPDAAWAAAGPALLAIPEVHAVLEARRREQKDLLLSLLASHGLSTGGAPITLADIGWRGSIQDNLARLLPGCPMHGCYFLLQPAFVPPPPGVSKESFLLPPDHPDRDRLRRRLRFAAPLELLVCAEQRSVTGYRRGPAGPVLVTDDRPLNTQAVAAKLTALRNAMAAAALVDGFDRPHGPQEAARTALSEILRFLETPPMAFIALYFETLRDESFGAGRLIDRAQPLELSLLIRAVWSGRARMWLGHRLADSGWPWALLKRDVPLLAPLLRSAMIRRDPRLL